jgi:hypothetical protein
LFILVTGSFRNLYRENKQKEVPRFFYIYTKGAFGANFPQDKINIMEQKFYSAPTGKETLGEFAYQILRRNETTGELEPMEFLFENEAVTKELASFMNYLAYKGLL